MNPTRRDALKAAAGALLGAVVPFDLLPVVEPDMGGYLIPAEFQPDIERWLESGEPLIGSPIVFYHQKIIPIECPE